MYDFCEFVIRYDTPEDSSMFRYDVTKCVRQLYLKYPGNDILDILDEEFRSFKKWYIKYREDAVFQFYSESAETPAPGKGKGEKILKSKEKQFEELAKIKDWRKMLSNFWANSNGSSLFKLDGLSWLSVEHYYQASKFKKGNYDFYYQFSLDSGSELSKDVVMAKGAGGKTGKSRNKQIRPKNVKIDADFFKCRSKLEMYKAQWAKYTQNMDLAYMLLLTGDAKLMHFSRGSPPIPFYDTMEIRAYLECFDVENMSKLDISAPLESYTPQTIEEKIEYYNDMFARSRAPTFGHWVNKKYINLINKERGINFPKPQGSINKLKKLKYNSGPPGPSMAKLTLLTYYSTIMRYVHKDILEDIPRTEYIIPITWGSIILNKPMIWYDVGLENEFSDEPFFMADLVRPLNKRHDVEYINIRQITAEEVLDYIISLRQR